MTQVRIEGDLYMKIKAYVETHPGEGNITKLVNKTLKEKINQLYREHLIDTLGEVEVHKVQSQLGELMNIAKKLDRVLVRMEKEQHKLSKEIQSQKKELEKH